MQCRYFWLRLNKMPRKPLFSSFLYKALARAAFLLLLALAVACNRGQDNALKIKGSDTVLPIAQRFAEVYAGVNPVTEISVTGGGSGVGIAALMENTTDIAMSSREIKLNEKLKLNTKGLGYKDPVIAYDALAVCVNPGNSVASLTREQLESIYTGKVRNWKDVGGTDMQIVVYSRESSSGTHEFFKEKVMNRNEFASDVLMMPATGAIIQSVSQTAGAIGYVGLAYVNSEVKALKVSYDQGQTYIEPTIENAISRLYPIVRPLYFIFLQDKESKVTPFISYIMSDTGQAEIKKLGFIPVPVSAAALPEKKAGTAGTEVKN